FMYDHQTTTDGRRDLAVEIVVAWVCKAGGACSYQLQKFHMPGAPPDQAMETVARSTKGEVTVKPDGSALVQPTTFMKTTPSVVELLKLSMVQVPAQPLGIGAIWHIDDENVKRAFTLTAVTSTGFTVVADAAYPGGDATVHTTLTFDRGEPIAQTLDLTQTATQPLGSGKPLDVVTTVTIQTPRE
ncbi:MAG: hypothetical protein ABI175_17815, partial [Polyangiales bacterium]